MPNKGHCAVLLYGKHSADRGCFTQSPVSCLRQFTHLYTMLKINITWELASLLFLPLTPHPRFCHLPKSNMSYLNSWDKHGVRPTTVRSTNLSQTRNETQYHQIKQSTVQSCLRLKILFGKDYSLGIHFFPLPRQEGDILTQTKCICSPII